MHDVTSPRPDSDESNIEQAIKAAGANKAPRVTPLDVDGSILASQFYVFPGTMVTVCCLTLKNGFTVVGESACASPENFNEEIGQRIAREDARQKIWSFLGFRLRDRLTEHEFDKVAFGADVSGPVWP